MAEESTPPGEGGSQVPAGPSPAKSRYDLLRWSIRITGILLMFAGTIYLAVSASALFTDTRSGNGLFVVVGSLIALGIGIYVLRIGLAMLRSINVHTIGSFSFVFALVYTFILVHLLPLTGLLNEHPILACLPIFVCFGASYWILKSILIHLLLGQDGR